MRPDQCLQVASREQCEALLQAALDNNDAALAHDYGLVLDMYDALTEAQPPTVLAAAEWYCRLGLKVFPIAPMSKIPYKGFRWADEATSDPDKARWWFTQAPDANVAIATGHGLDVVDIDGAEGNKAIAPYIDALDIRGVVSTPRPGGRHLYVPAVPGRGNRAHMLPAVDYRGLGGYVVAPPSRNEQGVYTWTLNPR